jgi:hypothetical protein
MRDLADDRHWNNHEKAPKRRAKQPSRLAIPAEATIKKREPSKEHQGDYDTGEEHNG